MGGKLTALLSLLLTFGSTRLLALGKDEPVELQHNANQQGLNTPIGEGHISAAQLHLGNASYRLGRALRFDPHTEQVIGDEEANNLLHDRDRGYRIPFLVPEQI